MHIAHSNIAPIVQPKRPTKQTLRVRAWIAKRYQRFNDELEKEMAAELAEIRKVEPDYKIK